MRGTCNVLVERDGIQEECGKPSVHSQTCLCDTCDLEPGYHLPTHWCVRALRPAHEPAKGLLELWK